MKLKTYKVGCKTSPTDAWTYNALRFTTQIEAETYGADLYSRWLALEAYEVHESDEIANYTMGDDGLKRIPCWSPTMRSESCQTCREEGR